MKRLLSTLVVLATVLVPATALAQSADFRGTFNGFAFGTRSAIEGEEHNWSVGHVWLIGGASWKELELLTIVAPKGPPSMLHNLQMTWRPKEAGWLDHLTIGRTQPTFGWEFRYRRDIVPTVNYSGITRHLVARDWGAEVGGRVGSVKLTSSIFLGKRLGGNIPEENRCCDIYLRGEYPLPRNVSLGVSFRGSAVNALGADLIWKKDGSVLSMELIQTEGEPGERFTEWVFLGEQRIIEGVRLVGRYEDLRLERRLTAGLVVGLGRFVELKFEENFVLDAPDQTLGQLVFRW